jgi:hypothetical protein
LKKKPKQEEIRWVARIDCPAKRKAAAGKLVRAETDRRWKIWMEVQLGGERRIDVARKYGYKDGSATTQILKRLARLAQADPGIRQRLATLQATHQKQMSSVKS